MKRCWNDKILIDGELNYQLVIKVLSYAAVTPSREDVS